MKRIVILAYHGKPLCAFRTIEEAQEFVENVKKAKIIDAYVEGEGD